ncbi:hypothetical protein BHE74_00048264, partial [Ensete ventricosum]
MKPHIVLVIDERRILECIVSTLLSLVKRRLAMLVTTYHKCLAVLVSLWADSHSIEPPLPCINHGLHEEEDYSLCLPPSIDTRIHFCEFQARRSGCLVLIEMSSQTAMSHGNRKPHFVLVPLFAQGHMIPMIDLARLLALQGVAVSVVTTPRNTARFKAMIDRANASGLLIRFIELRFPCTELGLPEGCENIDLLPSGDLAKAFIPGLSMLREPLLLYLRQQCSKPSCIISDACLPWTGDVGRELRVPRFVFHGPSCFFLLCTHNVSKHKSGGHLADASEPFLVPDFPHKLEVVSAQSLKFFELPGWEKFFAEVSEEESKANGFVINSFRELEAAYIDGYQKALGKKVWAIGPVCLSNKEAGDKVTRGNKMNVDENHIRNWLDAKEAGSVVYVSFGSLVSHSASHLIEIGLGLEASKRPFIWVVKEKELSPEVASWLSEGFEERTSSRGLILRGWAPQMLILSHPSLGGFMTHCGWNSTLEAVSVGVPMITWPHFFDQFLNER